MDSMTLAEAEALLSETEQDERKRAQAAEVVRRDRAVKAAIKAAERDVQHRKRERDEARDAGAAFEAAQKALASLSGEALYRYGGKHASALHGILAGSVDVAGARYKKLQGEVTAAEEKLAKLQK